MSAVSETAAGGGLVLQSVVGRVATVTLNRADRHNSLVPGLLQQLIAAFDEIDTNDDSDIVVLQADGPSFSTGGDLGAFLEHENGIANYADGLVGLLNAAIVRIIGCRVPVLVVVDGQVTGGALGLVLAGDVVLVTERASFTPYYVEVGFSPDGGWTALLPDLIGRVRASTVQLLNQTITAELALEWGIATAYADSGDLDVAVRDLKIRLLKMQAGSVKSTRKLLRPPDLATRLDSERKQFVERMAAEETLRGIRAFLARPR